MKTLEEIKQKVRDFSEEIIQEVDELCNSLPYQDSSNVSFIIDYTRRLLEEVGSIELCGK